MSLTPAYTCSICRRTLTLPPGQIIGEKPEEHQARVAKLLSEHLGADHKEAMAHAMLTGNALMGLVILFHFQHNDAAMHEYIKVHAQGVRRFTSRFMGRWRITDAMIEQNVADYPLGLSRDEAVKMLKSMRDEIDEAPEQPATVQANQTPAIPK